MTLPYIIFRESGLPAFMVRLLSFGNTHKSRSIKVMIFTELADTNNSIFGPIRCSDDESFHVSHLGCTYTSAHLGAGFRTISTSQPSKANLLYRLWGMLCAAIMRWPASSDSTHVSTNFRRNFLASPVSRSAKLSLPVFLSRFRRWFQATVSSTYLFASFSRAFYAKARTSNTSNVKALTTERFQGFKPVLFACRQQFRNKYQFHYFKGKGLLSVLVPCGLKFGVVVSIATEIIGMSTPPFVQVYGTSNINLVDNGTSDAVDTAGVGDRSGIHASNCLSLAPCSCRLPEEQGYSLFAWGNYSHAMQPSSYYTILSAHPKSGSCMHIGHGR